MNETLAEPQPCKHSGTWTRLGAPWEMPRRPSKLTGTVTIMILQREQCDQCGYITVHQINERTVTKEEYEREKQTKKGSTPIARPVNSIGTIDTSGR